MKRAVLAAALAWSASLGAQPTTPIEGARGENSNFQSDWEREQEKRGGLRETDVRLPAPPPKDGLIEFNVSAASSFHFYIDPASLWVGGDGTVRYTLVARSASGADNISYEAIHCPSGRYKVYALGTGKGWSAVSTEWKAIEPKPVQRWHHALRREYFCPFDSPVKNVAQALRNLREGGDPDIRRNR